MMEGSIQFCLLAALLLAMSNSTEIKNLYFKLGGMMVLRPPDSERINSIVWKFKGNPMAEWATNGVPLTYYNQFNGRTTLNTETGELKINNMSKDDSGTYVVKINNVLQPQWYSAGTIKEVPDPSVSLRPLTCGLTSNSCKLLCDGDITESEPVTFYWRTEDGEWKESKQDMDITNDNETQEVQTFSCRMKNPVSEKDSEPEPNPFLEKAGDSVSNSADAQKILLYFKLGGTMVLRPRVSGTITRIVYKSKGNLVAEWAMSGVPLTYYGSFDGRTTLNTETGELKINNMSKDDFGEYVVEINDVVLPQRFEAVEIKEVPDPVVTPTDCNLTSKSCKLMCNGNITESGPVTFYWRMGDREWKESKQDMSITNDNETQEVQMFSCRMKNPVSEKDSEPEPNPFLEKAGDSASSSAEAQKIPTYFKLGGTMVLRPPVSVAITSIVYKFNGNLVAKWAVSGVSLTYYGSFDGRTKLNTETGELKINNMSKDDIGEYVVEINIILQRQWYSAMEIKDVLRPSVTLRPLTCGPASNSCNLLCDGDITESGPVTFYWRMGDGEWKESKQDMNITNDEETKRVQTFSCRMKNPVSEKDSDPEPNPFLEKAGDSGLRVELIGVVVRSFVVLLLSGVVVFLFWRKRKLVFLCKCGKGDNHGV